MLFLMVWIAVLLERIWRLWVDRSGDIEGGVAVELDVSVRAGACCNVCVSHLCVADTCNPIR